jgi:stearoyl-CoA desaturase (delta-9 desaturase)
MCQLGSSMRDVWLRKYLTAPELPINYLLMSTSSRLPPGVQINVEEARHRARSYGVVLVLVGFAALAAPIWAFLYGVGTVEVSAFCLFYVMASIGQGIGLHRYFSHHSFETSKAGRTLLGILAVMSMQGPIIAWVADHRRHHAHTDQCGDTHSPSIDGACAPLAGWKGLWHAQLGWIFGSSYSDPRIFASDIADDAQLRALDRTRLLWYAASILVLPAAYGWLLGGSEHIVGTVLVAGAFRAFLFSQSVLALNSLAHSFGNRRFEQANTSCNNALVAALTLGEGWHNNHHRFPRSAHVGVDWYEIDVLGEIIHLCEILGLVWNVRRMPARARPLMAVPRS